ncbi:MAG TPA: hypothetical protein VHX65_06560 [Pirellulales bacterium]|jgi:hypothetical protein|nr:hypothetical protein [Pirellulales bacterium]
MTYRPGFNRGGKTHLGRIMMVALVVGLFQSAAFAADAPPKFGNALDWVPADAAVFSSTMRLKEQVEIVANSKAWAKFKEIPVIQESWSMLQLYYSMGATEFNQTLQKPENQQLIDMLLDLFSNEISWYADQQTIDLIGLAEDSYNAAAYNPSAFEPHGGANSEQAPKAMVRAIINKLSAHLDKLKIPTIVLAFKHSDAARVKTQLARLEKAVNDAIAAEPNSDLKGRFQRSKIGGDDYLTLKLDGKMVPWNEALSQAKDYEEKPGQLKQIVDRLKQLEMMISIGVRGDYLLIALTPSAAPLAALGSGPRMVEREEFQPLYKLADKRLVGIGFESKEAAIAMGSHDSLDNLMQMALGAASASGMAADVQARLRSDLTSLKKDLRSLMPAPGASLSSSVLTERGYDCYAYSWAVNPRLDGSKPLDIMEHLGGTPLVAILGRTKTLPEDYPMSVKWLTKAQSYFEELALPTLTTEQKREYHEWMEFAKPLLARLNNANIAMLQPALADGQHAFVWDAKIISRRWFNGMPQDSVLPMFEPALVWGVSDADLLKKGIGEYRAVADEIVAKIKQKEPNALAPGFKIPDAQVREVRSGTIYSYPLPRELGVDGQLAPGAGLGKHVAVLTLSPEHTAELLSPTPFEAEGPAGDMKRPLASASFVDCAGLVEASTPWIEYVVRLVYAKTHEGEGASLKFDKNEPEQLKKTLAQVRSGLEILKVLRTVSSATYVEGKAVVTHTEVHIRDLP